MAEIKSKVYDIVYPSPIPLKDLSAIAVAIDVWRLYVNQNLEKCDFGYFFYALCNRESKITLRDIIPRVPLVIYQIINKYLHRLIESTNFWLRYHFNCLFSCHRDKQNDILKDFSDIACDYDGTIDNVRTAKRMMLCDQISQVEKFKIACAYSLEEDIRRIWPSVQSKVDLNEIECLRLHYWVCTIRNELDKIPNEENAPIGDLMLNNTPYEYRSSIDYFWDLAGLESRYDKAVTLLCTDASISFCGRFILPKLSEEQLTTFVAERGVYLIYCLWLTPESKDFILAVWMYIKDKMNETNFLSLIEKFLSDETMGYTIDDPPIEKSDYDKMYHDTENLTTCCEIWASAADNLKRSVIKKVLTKESLFEKPEPDFRQHREIRFLMTVLLDATSEDRSIFWSNNWINLLSSTHVTDLQRIMKLCLANEDEIIRFKKSTMAKYENLDKIVKLFLEKSYFKELTNLLNFISTDDVQSRRALQRQCLQSNFLGENSAICRSIVYKPGSIHDFIDDAYADNADLINEFHNQFLSTSSAECQLLFCMQNGYFRPLTEFVNSFAFRGQNVEPLKKCFVDELREDLTEGRVRIGVEALQTFLLWCLGCNDRVIQFKQSITPEEVLRNMVENERSSQENENNEGLLAYPHNLDEFLAWYFDSPEEMKEFKTRFADVFKMFAPPTRRRY